MSDFTPAFIYLMSWEDPTHQYANEPDEGAFAISGINSSKWPADYAAIAAIPQAERGPAIVNFYLSKFWTPLECGQIGSQDVANRVHDEAVNGGPREAVLLLQRAVNSIKAGTLTQDGQIGPQTLAGANSVDPVALLAAYRQERASFYRAVVAAKPSDSIYLSGWLKRAEA